MRPRITSSPCLLDSSLACSGVNSFLTEPPVIMLDQADVSGNQLGASLTISPTITLGLPLADVTWARSNQGNDQVLDRNDPRVTISSGGVLTVTDVVASDRGEYTVTASNIAAPSGVTASVQVFIECKLLQVQAMQHH